jgi:hypothetical protein
MKIKLLSFFLLIIYFCIPGCAYIPTPPPLPETLNIQTPSPDIPTEIASFSGIWEGKWGESLDTIIVIEKIDNQKAELIFSHGKLGNSGIVGEASYASYTASVLPGPKLEWRHDTKPACNPEGYYQCPCKFTLELTKDKDMLTAYWEYTDYKFKWRSDLRRRK